MLEAVRHGGPVAEVIRLARSHQAEAIIMAVGVLPAPEDLMRLPWAAL